MAEAMADELPKCPQCGIEGCHIVGAVRAWGCGSWMSPTTSNNIETKTCLRRQLAQRDARIAELEAKLQEAARLARDSAERAGELVPGHGRLGGAM